MLLHPTRIYRLRPKYILSVTEHYLHFKQFGRNLLNAMSFLRSQDLVWGCAVETILALCAWYFSMHAASQFMCDLSQPSFQVFKANHTIEDYRIVLTVWVWVPIFRPIDYLIQIGSKGSPLHWIKARSQKSDRNNLWLEVSIDSEFESLAPKVGI